MGPVAGFGHRFQNDALSSIATVLEEEPLLHMSPVVSMQPPLKKTRVYYLREATENLLQTARKKQDFIRRIIDQSAAAFQSTPHVWKQSRVYDRKSGSPVSLSPRESEYGS